jgi:hypothetical protein
MSICSDGTIRNGWPIITLSDYTSIDRDISVQIYFADLISEDYLTIAANFYEVC